MLLNTNTATKLLQHPPLKSKTTFVVKYISGMTRLDRENHCLSNWLCLSAKSWSTSFSPSHTCRKQNSDKTKCKSYCVKMVRSTCVWFQCNIEHSYHLMMNFFQLIYINNVSSLECVHKSFPVFVPRVFFWSKICHILARTNQTTSVIFVEIWH